MNSGPMRAGGHRAVSPRSGRASTRPPVLPARVMGVLLVILVLVTMFRFRTRDATLAIAGIVDIEIIREVAVWGLVGLVVALNALTVLGRGRGPGRWRLGPALRALVLVTLVIAASAIGTGSTRSWVRAAQWIMLVAMVLLAYREVIRDADYLEELWTWIRRSVWAGVLLAAVATAVNPAWGPLYSEYFRIARYRFFVMHPIPTGALIGFGLILLVGTFLGLSDRLADAPWGTIGRAVVGAFFLYLLFRTKSRGAILATAAGCATLLFASPLKNRRRTMLLAGFVALGGLALASQVDVTADRISRVVFRGQSIEVLATLNSRTELFDVGFGFFLQKPIFGWGYLTGGQTFLQFFDWAGEAHNAYLAILFSLGLVGAAAFAALFFFVIRQIRRARKSAQPNDRALAAEAAGLTAFVLVDGMVSEGFAGSVGVHVFALMAAVLLVDAVAARRRSDASAIDTLRDH